jgi:hypothetical protein
MNQVNILEDITKKIKALSQKMDEQLNNGDFHDYNRLAETYIALIREYRSISKPSKYPTDIASNSYYHPSLLTSDPLKWNEITCNHGKENPYDKNMTFDFSVNTTETLNADMVNNLAESIKAKLLKKEKSTCEKNLN